MQMSKTTQLNPKLGEPKSRVDYCRNIEVRHALIGTITPFAAPFAHPAMAKGRTEAAAMVRVPGAARRAGFMTGLPRFARNDGGG